MMRCHEENIHAQNLHNMRTHMWRLHYTVCVSVNSTTDVTLVEFNHFNGRQSIDPKLIKFMSLHLSVNDSDALRHISRHMWVNTELR